MAPEDTGLPTTIPYVQKAVVRIRKHTPDTTGLLDVFAVVLINLYGPEIKIEDQFSNGGWVMIGRIAGKGEKPKIPRQHTLPPANEGDKQRAFAVNIQIRTEGLQPQNVDKGLNRFIRHFKAAEPVAATLGVEE
jgi:hypothetical protein